MVQSQQQALCVVTTGQSVAQVPLCAGGEPSALAAGFGGWWYACDAEAEVEHLADALLGDAELLAGGGEGEPLDGAEAEDLAVALVRQANRSLWGWRQHEVVLVELAENLVEGICSDLGVPEQLTAGMVEQLVHGADTSVVQARLSGWAQAQLVDVH
jgi:hypothetical protein